jgi:hypothetical protein
MRFQLVRNAVVPTIASDNGSFNKRRRQGEIAVVCGLHDLGQTRTLAT